MGFYQFDEEEEEDVEGEGKTHNSSLSIPSQDIKHSPTDPKAQFSGNQCTKESDVYKKVCHLKLLLLIVIKIIFIHIVIIIFHQPRKMCQNYLELNSILFAQPLNENKFGLGWVG